MNRKKTGGYDVPKMIVEVCYSLIRRSEKKGQFEVLNNDPILINIHEQLVKIAKEARYYDMLGVGDAEIVEAIYFVISTSDIPSFTKNTYDGLQWFHKTLFILLELVYDDSGVPYGPEATRFKIKLITNLKTG